MPSDHTTALNDLLTRHGFARHTMFRNKAGHLQVIGSLNGRPLEMLVDTGASATVINLEYCRQLGVPLLETSRKGGGAGGMSLSLYTVDGTVLQIGPSPISLPSIHVMDMSHVNKGLAMKGADPVQVVVGADVLLRHEAIIDYANLALFLRIAG